MERHKRRLGAVPPVLGPCRGIRPCDAPGAGDVDGALRLEGLLSMPAARRLRPTLREAGPVALRDAVIRLGGGMAALGDLPVAPQAATVPLWPSPDAPEGVALERVAPIARPQATRRRLAARAAVATDRIGRGVLAALLGRPVLPRGAGVLACWRAWGAVPVPAAPASAVLGYAA